MLSKILLAIVVITVMFLAGLHIYESYRSNQENGEQEQDNTVETFPQF